MNLLDLAASDPGAPALDDMTRRLTRAELVERSCRVAHALRDELVVGPGEHIALLVGNRTEFVELCLGALFAGVWVTPINWHLAPDEIAHVLADSGSKVLVVDPDHRELAARLGAGGGPPRVQLGDEYEDLLAASADRRPDLTAAPGGTMFYTSGTTGRPKGVKRARAGSLGAALDALPVSGRVLGLDGGGPHLVTGPLYHAAPLGFAVMDQHAGAEVVVMPRFDPQRTIELLEGRQVRNTHLVPTMFVRLLALPDERRERFDSSSLHTVLHGAAPIAESVKRRMIDWWGEVLVEYWGGSEGGVATLIDSADWLAHPGSVGRAVPSYEVYAGDEHGRPLTSGDEGLLWCRHLRTEQVFEYHESPSKTAEAHPEPGVYTLGDLGRVDEDGYVWLSDRRSNLIISGGVNIYPAEVERVLADHPAIRDVAVFGVPDDEWGESVKAAVELEPGVVGSDELVADLLVFARERLAGFKVPRSVDIHAALPRHDTGKLYTRLLRDAYRKS